MEVNKRAVQLQDLPTLAEMASQQEPIAACLEAIIASNVEGCPELDFSAEPTFEEPTESEDVESEEGEEFEYQKGEGVL